MTGQRHTDARGHLGDPGQHDRGMRDAHGDAFGEPLCRLAVGDVAAHEHEAFAVHVSDDVTRPGHRAQPLRDRFDEVTARGVAEPLFDEAEVVELHRHDRESTEVQVAEGQPRSQPVEVEDGDARRPGIVALGRVRRTRAADRRATPTWATAISGASTVGTGSPGDDSPSSTAISQPSTDQDPSRDPRAVGLSSAPALTRPPPARAPADRGAGPRDPPRGGPVDRRGTPRRSRPRPRWPRARRRSAASCPRTFVGATVPRLERSRHGRVS